MRKHGLACDNLVAADVVTADGRVPARQRRREPGPVLGAARRRRQLRRGHLLRVRAARGRADRLRRRWSSTRARRPSRCCDGYRRPCATAPDELTTMVNLTTAPPVPFLPESVHGKPIVAVVGCWSGTATTATARTRGVPRTGHRSSPTCSGRCPTSRCSSCSTRCTRAAAQLLPVGVPPHPRRRARWTRPGVVPDRAEPADRVPHPPPRRGGGPGAQRRTPRSPRATPIHRQRGGPHARRRRFRAASSTGRARRPTGLGTATPPPT